jgi:FkbM family methyltransferase
MNIVKLKTRQALRYWNRFGFINGSRMLTDILLRQGRIRLPHYKTSLLARNDTSDVMVFEKVFLDQEYDFPVPDLQPKLIIDAGANVGYVSIFFAAKYPEARILAIEPEESNYELLVRNTAQYPNITPIQAALWNKKGRVRIDNPGEEKWAFRVTETDSTGGAEIEALTIQDLLSLAGTDYIDILKIDIEGAEKELFESNYETWLGKVGVMMIELHDRFVVGCSRSFYRAVGQYQFNQSIKGENLILVKYE